VVRGISLSKYIRILEPYVGKYDAEYSTQPQLIEWILQKEGRLQGIVQLVGKDTLRVLGCDRWSSCRDARGRWLTSLLECTLGRLSGVLRPHSVHW
jgi:hypothetical protein